MQSKVDRAPGRFGAPVLVVAVTVCTVFLMAVGPVVGGAADATPDPATAIGIVALLLVGGVLLYFGRRRQN